MAWFLTRPHHRHKQVTADATIGRDPSCSIVLDGPSVSRVHCRVRTEGERLVLENCSQYGTQVNGRQIERSVVVAADDVIDLPGHRIVVVQRRNTLPLPHEVPHDDAGALWHDGEDGDGDGDQDAPRSPVPARRLAPSPPRKPDSRADAPQASTRARTRTRPPKNAPPSSAVPSTVAPSLAGSAECLLWVVEDEETTGERYCDAIAVGDEGSILVMLDIIEGPTRGNLADLLPQWRAHLRLVGMRAGSPDQLLEELHRSMIEVGVKARGVCARVDVPERVALVSSAGGVAPWVVRDGGRLASVRLPTSVAIGTGRATRFAVRAVHFGRGDTLWVSSEGWAADLEAALATAHPTREEVLNLLKTGDHERGGAVFCLARMK